ncbi:MAG: hypothetical protein A2V69_00020 [Candidatus Portnoybacteria bacterium RBG_13_40_8]|uniref:ATP-grasp domain-containing protein n=1 Tax=Candidatus Portnoybacteria bacterium RBG_13_40_8 TaxID=1801990 RepID=A0A1G2F3I0_9BACT|nr:MAG: hypothetical protein A2V69_00020 [Candidatus Portnoybacteria bacterium RBG_13_40_8]
MGKTKENRDVDFSILVEGAGTATAISVFKGLTCQNEYTYKTIGMDMDDFVAGKYFINKFYKSLPSKDEKYIDYVLDICKKESVRLYIPIIDYGFEKLSKSKEKFKKEGIYLMIADPDSIKACTDKYLTYQFFEKNSIPTPETFLISEKEKVPADWKLIIKPRLGGRATLDVHPLDNKSELDFYLKKSDNYIIQRFIEGTEFTVDGLNSLDGTIFINAVVRERIETKGGLSVKIRMTEKKMAEKIKKYIEKITTTLKLPGAYNIQGFTTLNGEIVFTEINPRFAGGHPFTIQAGLNSIKYILDMLSKRNPRDIKKEIKLNDNLKMVRYWNEIFVDGKSVWTWKNLIKK